MSKNYNPEMPSTGYDVADLAALKASNLMPALKEDRLCRFDSTDDASIFFARELDYIKSKSYDKIYPEFTALNKFPITHLQVDAEYALTVYGLEFLTLRRNAIIPIVSAGEAQ